MDAFAAYDIPKRGEKIVNYTEKHGLNVVDSHDLNYFCSAEHMYRRTVVKETYVTDVLLL